MAVKRLRPLMIATIVLTLPLCPAVMAQADPAPSTPHIIGAPKLIVDNLDEAQAFFEVMFGMKEVRRYDGGDTFEESIVGFEEGARLALFAPKPEAEKPLEKSQYPVVLLYTPELDAVTKRLEEAGHPARQLGNGESGSFRITITRDPSGNAVELLSRPGKWEVGGSKLIVDDREKAEAFYAKIFGATAGQRYVTDAYDEVLMQFGQGPFLALFQPLAEKPLPKSQYPVTAIYTTDFDEVLKRIEAEGLGYRKLGETEPPRVIIAQDPAGNAIEIIRR